MIPSYLRLRNFTVLMLVLVNACTIWVFRGDVHNSRHKLYDNCPFQPQEKVGAVVNSAVAGTLSQPAHVSTNALQRSTTQYPTPAPILREPGPMLSLANAVQVHFECTIPFLLKHTCPEVWYKDSCKGSEAQLSLQWTQPHHP